MIKIKNEVYINQKEAAVRYGYSPSWFSQRRYLNLPPNYLKMGGKGKVFYPLEKTDKWFYQSFEAEEFLCNQD